MDVQIQKTTDYELSWDIIRCEFKSVVLSDYQIPELVRRRRNSPLRWVGSKSKATQDLFRLRPKRFATFCEPFAGSAAMAFYVRRHLVGNPDDFKILIADTNEDLINFYQCLKADPDTLTRLVLSFPSNISLLQFRVIKQMLTNATGMERAAAFYVINRNAYGGFQQASYGNAQKRDMFSLATTLELPAFSQLLQSIDIKHADFIETLSTVNNENTWVYLDPPYTMIKSDSEFWSEKHKTYFYNDVFDKYEELAQLCKSTKASIMVSIDDTPATRTMFAGLNTYQRKVRYIAHRDQGGEKHRSELVVLNYDIGHNIITELGWERL